MRDGLSLWDLPDIDAGVNTDCNPFPRPVRRQVHGAWPVTHGNRAGRGIVPRPLSPYEALTGERFWDHPPEPELDAAVEELFGSVE